MIPHAVFLVDDYMNKNTVVTLLDYLIGNIFGYYVQLLYKAYIILTIKSK